MSYRFAFFLFFFLLSNSTGTQKKKKEPSRKTKCARRWVLNMLALSVRAWLLLMSLSEDVVKMPAVLGRRHLGAFHTSPYRLRFRKDPGQPWRVPLPEPIVWTFVDEISLPGMHVRLPRAHILFAPKLVAINTLQGTNIRKRQVTWVFTTRLRSVVRLYFYFTLSISFGCAFNSTYSRVTPPFPPKKKKKITHDVRRP